MALKTSSGAERGTTAWKTKQLARLKHFLGTAVGQSEFQVLASDGEGLWLEEVDAAGNRCALIEGHTLLALSINSGSRGGRWMARVGWCSRPSTGCWLLTRE